MSRTSNIPGLIETASDAGPDRAASGRAWLVSAIAIALVLQLIAAARSPLIAPDGIGFIQYARELGDNPWAAIRGHAQHPGYPLMVLATHTVTGRVFTGDAGWEFAARLACGLSGLACVALIWLFVLRVVDATAANVAAVLFVVLPTVRQNAADAISDSTHLALYLCAAWLVCSSADRSWWRLVFAGAASGLAFLVRPEGLAVAVVAAGCVVFVPAWRTALGTRRALIGAMAVLAGAALVAAPLVVVSGKLTGKLAAKVGCQQMQNSAAPATSAPTGQPAQHPPDPRARNSPVVQVPGAPTPWDDPPSMAAMAAVGRLGTALAEVFHGVLLLPLLVGIPIASRRMGGTSYSLCLMLAISQVGMLLLLYVLGGYIDRRHLLPLVAMLMPSVSLGTLVIDHWLTGLGEWRRGTRWLAPTAAVVVLAVLVPRAIRPLHESHLHTLQAAAWLREHGQRNDVVGSNAAEVIYHASVDGGISPGSLLRSGHRIDADGPLLRNTYLVVELDAGNLMPAWSSAIPGEFAPVARIIGEPGLRQRDLVIYRRGASVMSAAVPDTSVGR